jgi:hypothetical protein
MWREEKTGADDVASLRYFTACCGPKRPFSIFWLPGSSRYFMNSRGSPLVHRQFPAHSHLPRTAGTHPAARRCRMHSAGQKGPPDLQQSDDTKQRLLPQKTQQLQREPLPVADERGLADSSEIERPMGYKVPGAAAAQRRQWWRPDTSAVQPELVAIALGAACKLSAAMPACSADDKKEGLAVRPEPIVVASGSSANQPPASRHVVSNPVACPLAAAVYLVQGLLGLSRLAVFTFLKDDLALTPASVALITSAGYAPWVRPCLPVLCKPPCACSGLGVFIPQHGSSGNRNAPR